MYQIDSLNAEMLRSFEMNVQPNLFSFTQLHTVWKVSCVQQTSGWDWTLNRNGLPREAEDHSPRTAQTRASQAQMRLGLASVTSRLPPVRKSKSNLVHSQKNLLPFPTPRSKNRIRSSRTEARRLVLYLSRFIPPQFHSLWEKSPDKPTR